MQLQWGGGLRTDHRACGTSPHPQIPHPHPAHGRMTRDRRCLGTYMRNIVPACQSSQRESCGQLRCDHQVEEFLGPSFCSQSRCTHWMFLIHPRPRPKGAGVTHTSCAQPHAQQHSHSQHLQLPRHRVAGGPPGRLYTVSHPRAGSPLILTARPPTECSLASWDGASQSLPPPPNPCRGLGCPEP